MHIRWSNILASLAAVALLTGCGDPYQDDAEKSGGGIDANGQPVEKPNRQATGRFATAGGNDTKSSGYASHAEGAQTFASGNASHTEGTMTEATAIHSHAEGQSTRAHGINSHAENYQAEANAKNSHAGGMWTVVAAEHTNAFIHATGSKNAVKKSAYPNTAHFDRLHLFEPANDDTNSVLARWQNDLRYALAGQSAVARAPGVGNRTVTNTATVGGGYFNEAGGFGTYIGGGMENMAEGDVSVISGGWANRAPGWGSTVGGGGTNRAEGVFATVPGGRGNTALGDFSLAAGHGAQALHDGAFVWADRQEEPFSSSARDQFLIRAAGGVGIGTSRPRADLDVNGAGYFERGIRFPPQGDISMGSFTNGP